MKYYEQLVDMACFSRNDLTHLTGSEQRANALIFNYKNKGFIQAVKRNLFVAISMETKQPVPSRYAIASHITDKAYVSHHSAFEYYGLANQVFYEVYVSSTKKFAPFEYDDVTYRFIASRISEGVEEKAGGVRITDLERTAIDSINDFEKIGGLEELLRCLELIPCLDESKLLIYLGLYDKQFIYQKTGYLLEHYKEQLKLSAGFFAECEKHLAKSIRYLYHGVENERLSFNSKWRLFVPEKLLAIISGGGTELV
jgi:predicted transcriptional regulator of viral defense system